MAFSVFSRNGSLLPMDQATIDLSNIAYAYGFGVYESVRVMKGVPLFLDEHLERLQRSAMVIGLEHAFSFSDIDRWTQQLIETINEPAFNLKYLLIGAQDAAGAELDILPLAARFPTRSEERDGVHVVTYNFERALPQAKTLNMLQSYLAYRHARETDAYDALLIDHEGCVREGTRTNFFTIKDRTITSPPDDHILPGVTRAHVVRLAESAGFTIRKEPIPMGKIANIDGAFLTSTSAKILPIKSVDDVQLQVPEAIAELQALYDEHLRVYIDRAANP